MYFFLSLHLKKVPMPFFFKKKEQQEKGDDAILKEKMLISVTNQAKRE